MSQNKPFSVMDVIFVVIVISILAPFTLFESKKVDRKRKISNIIGVLLLLTILIGVTISQTIVYLNGLDEEKQVKKLLKDISIQFASHDHAGMMNWAQGNVKDLWGNSVILVNNDPVLGVQFLSKGKDVLSKEDDIQGEIVPMRPKPIPQIVKIIEYKEPGIVQKTKSSINRIKNWFGSGD